VGFRKKAGRRVGACVDRGHWAGLLPCWRKELSPCSLSTMKIVFWRTRLIFLVELWLGLLKPCKCLVGSPKALKCMAVGSFEEVNLHERPRSVQEYASSSKLHKTTPDQFTGDQTRTQLLRINDIPSPAPAQAGRSVHSQMSLMTCIISINTMVCALIYTVHQTEATFSKTRTVLVLRSAQPLRKGHSGSHYKYKLFSELVRQLSATQPGTRYSTDK
jgi:hypothetical protein